ncbi:unnamed protein product [Caenorhabditis auriculariae]|uniref:Uncharacterized protein n=1 Tax=Caenorhabditis auriculariae TaxID=2777116 RepID=A0A8S1H260_9PELO|nr:unnamed protein product [Caenorhabditis auriculariae]
MKLRWEISERRLTSQSKVEYDFDSFIVSRTGLQPEKSNNVIPCRQDLTAAHKKARWVSSASAKVCLSCTASQEVTFEQAAVFWCERLSFSARPQITTALFFSSTCEQRLCLCPFSSHDKRMVKRNFSATSKTAEKREEITVAGNEEEKEPCQENNPSTPPKGHISEDNDVVYLKTVYHTAAQNGPLPHAGDCEPYKKRRRDFKENPQLDASYPWETTVAESNPSAVTCSYDADTQHPRSSLNFSDNAKYAVYAPPPFGFPYPHFFYQCYFWNMIYRCATTITVVKIEEVDAGDYIGLDENQEGPEPLVELMD